MTNRPANLNPTHVILVQTNKMLLPVTSILVIQRQEDPHVNQYLILDWQSFRFVLIMAHNVFLHNQLILIKLIVMKNPFQHIHGMDKVVKFVKTK